MMARQCKEMKEKRDRERVKVWYVDGAIKMSDECHTKRN
jgi:hypothetical protein